MTTGGTHGAALAGFYITLKEATDRQKQMADELAKQPNLHVEPWFVDKARERYTTDSHIAVLREAIRRGMERVIVFEDDAIFPEDDVDVHAVVEEVDRILDGQWQVLLHGQKTKNWRHGDGAKVADMAVGGKEGSLFRVFRSVAGCHGYTVNGVEAMAELIEIQRVSEFVTSRQDSHDNWFKGVQPNKTKGRHCIEGALLRERDLWYISDLAYVTEQHIDGYSYRMKNTKSERWDDESADKWVRRLSSPTTAPSSPPKEVLVVGYRGLLAQSVAETIKSAFAISGTAGGVLTMELSAGEKDVLECLAEFKAHTKNKPGRKHVIFVVTSRPEFVVASGIAELRKWAEQIAKVVAEKHDFDKGLERSNNDRRRRQDSPPKPRNTFPDFAYTILHAEDFLLGGTQNARYLGMRLGLSPMLLRDIEVRAGQVLRETVVAQLQTFGSEAIQGDVADESFDDPLAHARF